MGTQPARGSTNRRERRRWTAAAGPSPGAGRHAPEPRSSPRRTVSTGLAVEIPDGQAGLLLPRSGLAARSGITLVNTPGLIDAGYRGELRVLLLNTDPARPFVWSAGDRIAQLVLVAVALAAVVEVDELSSSPRGLGGFGSSGV
jgi:dUTP pyrophosphatase